MENHHLDTESKARKRTRSIVNLWLKLFAQRTLAALIYLLFFFLMETATDFGTDFELQMRE